MSEPLITDWIMAASSVSMAVIAVVTFFSARKQYLVSLEQESDPDIAQDEGVDDKPSEVLVFKTPKQTTTLKITNLGLECHLEDVRENKGGHQWTLSQKQVRRILDTNDYAVNPTFRSRTGTFSLGARRNWLYSKVIFPEPEYLHGTLTDLLNRVSN